MLKRDAKPWRTMQGIEFRSVTIEAFKGKQGACFERNQGVIYRGPFREVLDDDNHRMERGVRYAVCDKTYNLYRKAPYREFFEFVEPRNDIPLAEATPSEGNEGRGLQPHDGREHLLRWRRLLLASRLTSFSPPATCRQMAKIILPNDALRSQFPGIVERHLILLSAEDDDAPQRGIVG